MQDQGPAGWFLVRALFLAYRWLSAPRVLAWLFPGHISPARSLPAPSLGPSQGDQAGLLITVFA